MILMITYNDSQVKCFVDYYFIFLFILQIKIINFRKQIVSNHFQSEKLFKSFLPLIKSCLTI